MEENSMSEKRKVLLVDDNPDFCEATKLILEKKGGYEVTLAYDGIEGLEKVKSDRPDIIVLDVMMPNKDGYKMCAELKADDEYRDIPIILLTAVASHISDTQYTPRMGMETEADDYLDKPAEPKEILRRVDALLKK
jgi:two-component system alkaline phosphatase synthesis response regulator PhoP